ncbi:MAG: MgtC/SapB family protein [Lachnospiraceae bacterium]
MSLHMQAGHIIRLVVAGICGGLIGYERQHRGKPAGLKTHVIIAMASALLMLISKYGFTDVTGSWVRVDPSRIASGVATAIGFLGSGIIFAKENKGVSGVTTSAGIWATVGVGLAIGAGQFLIGIFTAASVLFVELVVGHRMFIAKKKKGMQTMYLELRAKPADIADIKEYIRENGKILSSEYHADPDIDIGTLSISFEIAIDSTDIIPGNREITVLKMTEGKLKNEN